MQTITTALVGIGGYGEVYLDLLLNDPRGKRFELVAGVDPMAQRCRKFDALRQAKVPVYASLDQLLSDRLPDLIILATPIHVHAAQTCQVLAAGTNVLCEKPLAASVDDAVRMAHAEEAASGFAAIGYQWSFKPAITALKRDIAAGTFGRPVRMSTLVVFPRPVEYFQRNGWVGRQYTAGGDAVFDSPVNNATAHYLHNMFYLLGATARTSATPATVQAELYRANEIENYDTAVLRCMTECGTEILFYTTHAASTQRGPVCRFEFEDAIVEYDALVDNPSLTARFNDGSVRDYGPIGRDHGDKLWRTADAIRSGKPSDCGIHAALPHTRCASAAQRCVRAIAEFPPHLKSRVPLGVSQMICVDGLDDILAKCFEQHMLPAELGTVDWARPASRVTIDRIADEGRFTSVSLPLVIGVR